MRILITSVGSLVGQNILDALEGRREGLWVAGTNSLAEAPNLFRCDLALRSPPAADPEAWCAFTADLMRRERFDLVFPARDDDILLLARLRDQHADLRHCITCGPATLAHMMEDKWQSYLFARARGLPFVETARAGQELAELVAAKGYPLVAKPPSGNGSRGVRIVFDAAQLEAAAAEPGCLFQEYLSPDAAVREGAELCRRGTPLFYAPRYTQLAAQAVIATTGAVYALYCGEVTMVMGRAERSVTVNQPDFTAIARAYADALAAAGWVGLMNLQGRRDAAGQFKVYELNGRIAGASTTRMLLGFDEVGMLAERFTGKALPPSPRGGVPERIVHKNLTEFVIEPEALRRFETDGRWERSP
ncbi:hypothetical protein BURK2_00143 [Burkholderiales bacterium]|nr:hypothetical protein BURK2_00143 [Burkholderiales bacterium]